MHVEQSDQSKPAAVMPAPPALPWPLCQLSKHPFRWTLNLILKLVAVVLGAYIGTHIVVAVYYLAFEVWAPATSWWHHFISDSDLRHAVRNVYEGLLGGLLAQQLVWNHYKIKAKRLSWLDRTEMKLGIANLYDTKPLSWWQTLASPVLAIIYGIPGFLVLFGITWLIRHNADFIITGVQNTLTDSTKNVPVLSEAQSTWIQDWDQKLMGYAAAFFFGRRPVKGVFDDMQTVFAARRIARERSGQRLSWQQHSVFGRIWQQLPSLMPAYQARINDIRNEADLSVKLEGRAFARVMTTLIVVSLLLAIAGVVILKVVAGA